MSVPPQSLTPHRSFMQDTVLLLLIYACIFLVALAFLWPLRDRLVGARSDLERYSPLQDGASTLIVQYDPEGAPLKWLSRNIAVLPQANAIATLLRPAQRNALFRHYPDSVAMGGIEGARIAAIRQRELSPGGSLVEYITLILREGAGEYLIGYYDVANNLDLIFDPPPLLLPAELTMGREWEAQGNLSSGLEYRFRGRVASAGAHEGAHGRFDDCLLVETRLLLLNAGESAGENTTRDWYCAGIGLVEGDYFEGDDGLLHRNVILSGTTLSGSAVPQAFPALPAGTSEVPSSPGSPDGWELSRVARVLPTGTSSAATVAPLWIPGTPPLLVAAGYPGELVALDVSGAPAEVQWRFHTAGTVYGSPTYDPARGRIYFGASDKRLYALDRNGLYLWSFESGDNIASRPLLLDDTLIFGSEDRRVYGLDVETGALRWSYETGAAVVSSSAEAGGLALIGSDDGGLYALDASTGEERWIFPTEGAIEAPIVVADGLAYAASRDGSLYVVDAATGEERWAAESGSILRTAPVLMGDTLYIVDDGGRVLAFERGKGRRLWATPASHYVGPPLLVEGNLVVAGDDGNVYLLDDRAREVRVWEASVATSAADASTRYRFGPSVGGGAIWLADDNAVVRRLGPVDSLLTERDALSLSLSWVMVVTEPPFREEGLYQTALPYEGRALLLDRGGGLYLLDPATGEGMRTGTLPAEGTIGGEEPVIAGDILIVVVDRDLHAFRLPDLAPLWAYQGDGYSARPAVVADDTVYWVTGGEMFNVEGAGTGTLHALDLQSGEPRWQAPLEGIGIPGSVEIEESRVYLSTPPMAFDSATGQALWRADVDGMGLGGPVLSDDGETLFVGTLDTLSGVAGILALDTSTGEVRWRHDLGDDALRMYDRLYVEGDTLVVSLLNGGVLALDAATGKEAWRYQGSAPRLGNVTVEDGYIWLLQTDGRFVLLAIEEGEEVATVTDLQLDLTTLSYQQRPTIIGRVLLVPAVVSLIGFEIDE